MRVQAKLVLPPGWRNGPGPLELSIEPKAEGHIDASFTTVRSWSSSTPRVAIALDVVVDGKYLGQIAEAVVDMRDRAT